MSFQPVLLPQVPAQQPGENEKGVVVSGGVFETLEGFLGGGALRLPAPPRPAPALWIPLHLPLTSRPIAILLVFKTKDHDHQDQGPNLTLQIQTGDKVHKYLTQYTK